MPKRDRSSSGPAPGDRSSTKKRARIVLDAAATAVVEDIDMLTTRYTTAATDGIDLSGQPGDGNFYARWVKMGQGDCIALATPGGKTLLVDCGSLASDGLSDATLKRFAQYSLFGKRFLGGTAPGGKKRQLDILVLTHPDDDHNNKLADVLTREKVSPYVDRIYNSADLGMYRRSTQTWVQKWQLDTGYEYLVTYNKDTVVTGGAAVIDGAIALARRNKYETKYVDVPVPTKDAATEATEVATADLFNYLDSEGRLVIHHEMSGCKISILASGVKKEYTKDNDAEKLANRASVVLLVEVFGKKLLLCGDATKSTETYLMEKSVNAAKNRVHLANVDVLHVAHHGSHLTSSSEAFMDLVKPRSQAVISAGKTGVKEHHLPDSRVVNGYADQFGAGTATEHEVWYWVVGADEITQTKKKLTAPVYTTGSLASDPWHESKLDIIWKKP